MEKESTIKIGIVGYGNVGKGVFAAIQNNPDIELTAIITRDVDRTKKDFFGDIHYCVNGSFIYDINHEQEWENAPIDVAILCGGSKNDLPKHGPYFAHFFNTVDSFDTHADIPKYFAEMNEEAKSYSKTAIISTGWDPGAFSLERVLADAFIPGAKRYTFWGPGVSQGHSDAIRQIKGVEDAIQFTMPIEDAINKVREGSNPELKTGEKHWRDCRVLVKADVPVSEYARIKHDIRTMPNYFADYETKVTFIDRDEMKKLKEKMPHAGFVITSGKTGSLSDNYNDKNALIEYKCNWASNPEATGNILVAHARAAYRMSKEAKFGAFTILDIPASYLSPHSKEKLLKEFM